MITILTLNRKNNKKKILFYLFKFIYLFFKRKYYLDFKSIYILVKYSGHASVVNSLVSGLKNNNIEFNINPKQISDFKRIVLVQSGVEQLEYAIKLKQQKILE